MPKLGRNDICACGSGKKYKKCCLRRDQEAERAARNAQVSTRNASMTEEWRQMIPPDRFCKEDLIDKCSNRVAALLDAGDLDGAEKACCELEEKFPDFIDCPEKRAMLCEARGEFEKAIAYNERCLEIIAAAPEGEYETAFIYEEAIARIRNAMDSNNGTIEQKS